MYKGYRIIANTAAGRRRYMQYLVPFVLESEIVDRYDIWINTHNGADIEFFKKLAEKFPKVNLVWQPDGIVDGIKSINAFYKDCIEEDAIYFKLDDDIIWMAPDCIRNMIDFRIENPEYFLVSPLVINNSASTYLLQVTDRIKLSGYCRSDSNHNLLWGDGNFAAQLHDWFISNYLEQGIWESLYIGKHPVSLIRFSINAILWFGRDLKAINGVVPGDDEEFLSCLYPAKIGKANCINGNTIISHFAFFTQRETLDRQTILERYGQYLNAIWSKNPQMKPIHEYIQETMNYIEENEKLLMAQPSPYICGGGGKERENVSVISHMARTLAHHLPTLYNLIKKTDKKEIPSYILK